MPAAVGSGENGCAFRDEPCLRDCRRLSERGGKGRSRETCRGEGRARGSQHTLQGASVAGIPEHGRHESAQLAVLRAQRAVLARCHLPQRRVLRCVSQRWRTLHPAKLVLSCSWPSGFQMNPQLTALEINIHQRRSINGSVAMWCNMYFCQNLLSINAYLL